MMRKWAGFLLLQLAALLYASQLVQGRGRRTEALLSFCDMLAQLRGILEAEAPPMPELLQTLSRRCGGEAAAFVNALSASMDGLGSLRFQELWQDALRRSRICEDAVALRELDALGEVLGRYALPAQLDAVSACLETLRRKAEHTRREQPVINRLTWGLAFSCSLLCGILLL